MPTNPAAPATSAPATTLERTLKAPVERVWSMWTTPVGIEAWYWPDPVAARVVHLDVRAGGTFEIGAKGFPQYSRGTYTEVTVPRRLAMRATIDFIPEVAPYERIDVLELHPIPGGTRMVLTCSPMHSPAWQSMVTHGWSSSFDRLAKFLDASR